MSEIAGQKFCYDCGGPLCLKWHALDQRERRICDACGAIHYESPKILVWCSAYCGDKILMCRRAIAPAFGLWNPPSGFVEEGESLEQAMARELEEETGIRVPPSGFILFRVASLPHMNQIFVGFRTEFASEPPFNLGHETSEARFFSEAEMPVEELAFRDMVPDTTAEIFRRLREKDFEVRILTLGASPNT